MTQTRTRPIHFAASFAFLTFVVSSIVSSRAAAAATTVRVLSDRTETTVRPLLDAFEKNTGIQVEAVFIDQGLVSRLEAKPTEADVVITKDAELLEVARKRGLLKPYSSPKINTAIQSRFRHPEDYYFVDAYRARAIIYSKTRVKAPQVANYEDLASPRFKGRLCMRSGYHEYNLSLFGQMFASWGTDRSRNLIKGYRANLARPPQGNDREQAKAIFENKCDVAVLNTYYFPIMQQSPEQRSWTKDLGLVYPNQSELGAFVMRSGLALTKSNRTPKAATELLEFFASPETQALVSKITHQFPTRTDVPLSEALKNLAAEQTNIKDGVFKMNLVPLESVAESREEVLKALNEVNFDKP